MKCYVNGTEVTKTSKRVIVGHLDGTEEKFLADFSLEGLGKGACIDLVVKADKSRYNMRIADSYTLLDPNTDADAKKLSMMYGDKDVPTIVQLLEKCADFINTTPDISYGGKCRTVTLEQLQNAIKFVFADAEGSVDSQRARASLIAYTKAPASIGYHDSQIGGLLRHTYKMLEIASEIYKPVPFMNYQVNTLKLAFGILMHDIGKVGQYTYNGDGTWSYADDSKYNGSHIGYGDYLWSRNGYKVASIFFDTYEEREAFVLQILHLIRCHHGAVENAKGSFISPMDKDDLQLHTLDFMESQQDETVRFFDEDATAQLDLEGGIEAQEDPLFK